MSEQVLYITNKMSELVEPTMLKLLAAGIISSLFFLFGNLYVDALVAILMLMIIDFVLAVSAAKFNGEPITSRKASRSLMKGIVYFSSISAGYFADLTVPGAFLQGSMVAFVGVTEFISVIENVGRHGYVTPKRLLNQLYDYQKSK